MDDKQLKILICDDSLLVRKKLREILEGMGCAVLEAKNGLEGFDVYKNQHPDAVFMDIVMPEADGLQALKMIHKFDENAKVIMLSSTGTASNLKEALKKGAYNFIQKPYNEEQIQKVIASIR